MKILMALVASLPALAQSYTISTYAGGAPLPTPVLAAKTPIGNPNGIAVDSAGNVYFSSLGGTNSCVFKIDANGILTQFAGTGRVGFSGDLGPATQAQLSNPNGLAFDGAGNLYIADAGNFRIRVVAPDGTISTVAGNGTPGYSGDGGPATSATLYGPDGLAVDSAGNLYISEIGNNVIRKVTPDGLISTVAGNGKSGFSGDGGPAIQAELWVPRGVAVDSAGNLYTADTDNHRIREVFQDGRIATIAGGGPGFGDSGDGGPAVAATLSLTLSVAVDSSGVVYAVEQNAVRKIATDGTISTFVGGPTSSVVNGLIGLALDSQGNLFLAESTQIGHVVRVSVAGELTTIAGNGTLLMSGDGLPAADAQLGSPEGIALDALGNLYIADNQAGLVRQVSPNGVISTVAVSTQPRGVATDSFGNLYYSDSTNTISQVSPVGATTTIAGGGHSGMGDGGLAFEAQLNVPAGLAVDASGNLYIADQDNSRIRKVDTSGIITTVAGNGQFGDSGDGGLATAAALDRPTAIAVDSAGSLYIADSGYVRKVTPDGLISTLAALAGRCSCYKLSQPVTGVATDSIGNVFLTEGNATVLEITPDGVFQTIAGSGVTGYSGDGGPALEADLASPYGVAVDSSGNVYVSDAGEGAIRLLQSSVPAPGQPSN